MSIKLLLFIFLATPLLLKSQVYNILIEKTQINIQPNDFYICEVLDGRINKSTIGYVRKGLFKNKVDADMVHGPAFAIKNYLDFSFPKDTSLTPITMKIEEFWIEQNQKNATVKLKVEFLSKNGDEYEKVFETVAFIEDIEKGKLPLNDQRIIKAINICLEEFINSDWHTIPSNYSSISKNEAEPISFQNQVPDKTNHVFWNSMLSFNQSIGANAKGWGLNYYTYVKKKDLNSWTIPPMFSIERFMLFPDYLLQTKYKEIELHYFMIGASAYKKIEGNLYFNLQCMLPMGKETLTNYQDFKQESSLFGITSSQGLIYIPQSKFGIVFGVSIYERFFTSEAYNYDVGIKGELGIKF